MPQNNTEQSWIKDLKKIGCHTDEGFYIQNLSDLSDLISSLLSRQKEEIEMVVLERLPDVGNELCRGHVNDILDAFKDQEEVDPTQTLKKDDL